MPARVVRIPAGTLRAIVAHARRDRPRECCGLLVGAASRVRLAVPLRNVARGRTRYRVDPAEHVALQRILRIVAPALSIVGVYHSHPRGRAVPSATDIAQALYPDWIHLIVGLGGRRPEVGVFRIAGGKATPIRATRAPR